MIGRKGYGGAIAVLSVSETVSPSYLLFRLFSSPESFFVFFQEMKPLNGCPPPGDAGISVQRRRSFAERQDKRCCLEFGIDILTAATYNMNIDTVSICVRRDAGAAPGHSFPYHGPDREFDHTGRN